MVDRTITLIRDDGKEIIADILFTYYSEDFQKDYVVFQVRHSGEISAASYVAEDGKNGVLDKIESEEEWSMLEDLLNDYAEEQNANNACGGGCGSCQGCQGSCDGCEDCEDCGK